MHLNRKNISYYYKDRKKALRKFAVDLITIQITSLRVNCIALCSMETNSGTLAMHQYSDLG